MYITQPGVPVDQLKGAGKEFVDGFTEANGARTRTRSTPHRRPWCCSTRSSVGGDDRAKVSEELFNTDIQDGISGNFQIDENGDTTLGTVSVYQVKNGKETFVKTITPELSFVEGG